MKTKEFLEKVKELGYIVREGIASYDIRLYEELGGLIATLNKKDQYRMLSFAKPSRNNEKLFDLCVEYAKTPIKEREEEEKKYYLRKKHKAFYEYCEYLNRHAGIGSYCLNTNYDGTIWKSQFTQEEIDKIKEEQDTDLSEFEQIPVEQIEAE